MSSAVAPRRHLALFGGGQLARMLALAAAPLGVPVRALDPHDTTPVAAAAAHRVGAYDDAAAIAWLVDGAAGVTWEREDIPLATLAALTDNQLSPRHEVLATVQDRQRQKTLFDHLGLKTAAWLAVAPAASVPPAATDLLPAMVKARQGGFDGRGQQIARTPEELTAAVARFAPVGCVIERLIPFHAEGAALLVRHRQGEISHYPIIRTWQHHGQLAWAAAPGFDDAVAQQGHQAAAAIAHHLGYVGVMALEFFVLANGEIVLNELAPRVHNSGHWTIEGAVTSQFENHVRAVLDLPLGATALRAPSLLANCLGQMPDPSAVLTLPDVHLHDYHKQPRAGRKVGHVTALGDDQAHLVQRQAALAAAGITAPLSW